MRHACRPRLHPGLRVNSLDLPEGPLAQALLEVTVSALSHGRLPMLRDHLGSPAALTGSEAGTTAPGHSSSKRHPAHEVMEAGPWASSKRRQSGSTHLRWPQVRLFFRMLAGCGWSPCVSNHNTSWWRDRVKRHFSWGLDWSYQAAWLQAHQYDLERGTSPLFAPCSSPVRQDLL